MNNREFLFPHRLDRRDLLKLAGTTAAGLALGRVGFADGPKPAVTIGDGKFRYTLDPTWGTLPAGMKYGFGCAVVVDGQDRVFVTSRSTNPCVSIFGRDGQLLETWSNDFAEKVGLSTDKVKDTAHGLYLSNEGGEEFLYWTENVSTNKEGPKFGKRMYKTDIHGKVLYTLGPAEPKTSTSAPFEWTNPTDVAVAPNGDIYVVDGYGSQQVYRFDKNFKPLKTIGGKGKEHGKFNTCHGVWINTLKSEPEVYIADRANDRLEVYSLDLTYKRTIPDFRKPCCFYQHDGHLYVPELDARVTVIDAADNVVAHLGDGKGVKKEEVGKIPDKFAAPHALTVDSHGDLYVIEWVDFGRPRKFRHASA